MVHIIKGHSELIGHSRKLILKQFTPRVHALELWAEQGAMTLHSRVPSWLQQRLKDPQAVADFPSPAPGAKVCNGAPMRCCPPSHVRSHSPQHYGNLRDSKTHQGSLLRLPLSLKLCFQQTRSTISDHIRSLREASAWPLRRLGLCAWGICPF